MAYFDTALLTGDVDFHRRISACFATEDPKGQNPPDWTNQHIWEMAAQPGFGDAYAYALANNNPAPGKDPAVITDGMILAAVQAVIASSV